MKPAKAMTTMANPGKSKAAAATAEWLALPGEPIPYLLSRKRVRNLNLRVRADGQVAVSAPTRMPKAEIEAFLRQKAPWIRKNRQAILARPSPAPCRYTREECLAHFTRLSDAVFPLFAAVLNGQKPTLKVREMKTRWGVCHAQRRVITLNTRLAEKPLAAQEYVILHEYVHFLHPDHQAGFHAEMARRMPDYKERRKLLKTY